MSASDRHDMDVILLHTMARRAQAVKLLTYNTSRLEACRLELDGLVGLSSVPLGFKLGFKNPDLNPSMHRDTHLTRCALAMPAVQVQAIMTCNGTSNQGCWFPKGMSAWNFRTQPTPSPAYTAISVSATHPPMQVWVSCAPTCWRSSDPSVALRFLPRWYTCSHVMCRFEMALDSVCRPAWPCFNVPEVPCLQEQQRRGIRRCALRGVLSLCRLPPLACSLQTGSVAPNAC